MATGGTQGPSWAALNSVDSFQLKFDWTIRDFLKVETLQEKGIISPDFGGPTKFVGVQCKAHGCVLPRTDAVNLGVYLNLEIDPANPAYEITARYEVSILAVSGPTLEKRTTEWTDFIKAPSMGYHKFLLLNNFKKRRAELLPDGNLTLRYEGEVRITSKPSTHFHVTTAIVKNLFESGNGSDFVIKARGREFKCHKGVLSFRSEYFRTMFQSGMKETQEGLVDFSDQMDGDVLEDLLEYLYFGIATNLKQTCEKMLKIADMLRLDELKSQCEEILIGQLNSGNSWKLLELAREADAKNLQRKAHLSLAKTI